MTREEKRAAKVARIICDGIAEMESPQSANVTQEQFEDALRMEARRHQPEVQKVVEHLIGYYA